MISFLKSLPAGNAVQCVLAPLDGASRARVLRKATDDIVDQDDPEALAVFEGEALGFIDTEKLTNGERYYYRVFRELDGVWAGWPSVSAVPAADPNLFGPDALVVVHDRLEAGLRNAVVAGKLHCEDGFIQVIKEPVSYSDNTKWPVVSIHPGDDRVAYRGVGEVLEPDEFRADEGDWADGEGWLSRISMTIIGWSMNGGVRNDLHRTIKQLLIANLSVFEDAGMTEIDLSFSAPDDTESYAAPVYMSVCTFTCVAPAIVRDIHPALQDVRVDVQAN